MRHLVKKYSVIILFLLISSFTLLIFNTIIFAQSKPALNKPINIKIDFPPSKASFNGFIGTIDKTGKPIIKKFSDPKKMADTLGVSVDEVLSRSKKNPSGGETTGSVTVTKSSNNISKLH